MAGELRITLADHACKPTTTQRQAKIIATPQDWTSQIAIRCGWPACNALLATVDVVFPVVEAPR
jgi:hypothetical protein